MKAPPFRYLRPDSVEQVWDALEEFGDEAKVLAGGQSLLPLLNLRLAHPAVLVDIGRLSGLRRLESEPEGGLLCGSLVTHHELELGSAPELAPFGALARAASHISHLPIRTRGTIGGSIAHADSASEWCLMALVMGAEIVAESRTGTRTIAASEFFHGFFTTALEPHEIITALRFPRPTGVARLDEYARRSGDFAIVAAAADVGISSSGRLLDARIALGGVAGSALRVPEAEAVLEGLPVADAGEDAIAEAAYVAAHSVRPAGDAHGSAAYRRRLVEVLVVRALRGCVEAQKEQWTHGG